MQFNRDESGKMTPLPKPSIDTGLGLERMVSIIQDVPTNYDTDLIRPIIARAEELAGKRLGDSHETDVALKVIADHSRAAAFLIGDGIMPSNEGRGYVLRRIIRRAIRHGYMLGAQTPFFYQLVAPLAREMGDAYPELINSQSIIESVLRKEEERFAETLETGMAILEQAIEGLQGKVIDGDTLFKLYDTYGFPVDLTADIARERALEVDLEGFEAEMEKQRDRARSASQFTDVESSNIEIEGETKFTGYEQLDGSATILSMFKENDPVSTLNAGDKAVIVLDQTPFYAESGGQAGDQGRLLSGDAIFEIEDTRKLNDKIFGHIGKLRIGTLKSGDPVKVEVADTIRQATALNHSATHLMHAALKSVLGDHVEQKGSLVNDHYLRFDFSHFSPMTGEELQQVQDLVNAEIRANRPIDTALMAIDEAKKAGAMALFGEKYGDTVRVVSMGDFSMELCGGTHVARTGDIGLFVIRSESGVAAGVRRIEALTGSGAMNYLSGRSEALARIGELLKGNADNAEDKVRTLIERSRELEKDNSRLNDKLASSAGSDLAGSAVDVQGIPVVAAKLSSPDAGAMRKTIDQLRSKLGSVVIVLGGSDGNKVTFVAGVSPDLTDRLHAGNLVKSVAEVAGGRGGGRPDMAQAGAPDATKLDAAIESVVSAVEAQLNG
jgi:alanyl-tRNA synthetase